MKTFQIGTFLTAEGEALTTDLANGRVSGYSRLRFQDGAVTVLFEAEARAEDAPPDVPTDSRIQFDHGDVESQQAIDGGIRISLKAGQEAFVSFHWPNPLTPDSGGLFLRFALVRIGTQHRLVFRRAPGALPNNKLRDHGYLFFLQGHENWAPVFLEVKGNNNTDNRLLTEFRDAFLGRPPIVEVKPESLQTCALLGREEAALIDSRPDRQWRFALRLAPAGENVWRPVAVVDDGDSGDARKELAVSARALRLEERPDLRPRPLRWRVPIVLTCASRQPEAVDPKVWLVDWAGVETFNASLGKDHFSLRGFWQELARHWALGLRSVRSRNALTFLPTDISPGDPSLVQGDPAIPRSWTFRFRVEKPDGVWRSRLVQVGSAVSVPLRFELASALDLNGQPTSFEAAVHNPTSFEAADGDPGNQFDALAAVRDQDPRNLLALRIGPSRQPLGELLVGGVLLNLGLLQDDGRLEVAFAASPSQLGQPPLAVTLDLKAAGLLPRPGTEDPERGFETENDLLGRERPLVVDLAPDVQGATQIEIREIANAARSRVLDVTVKNAEGTNSKLTADVIVIDPAPLLVARVQASTDEITQGQIIASYHDDGEQPVGWEMATTTGAMTLILPPQTIGEEMIKGNLTIPDGHGRLPVPLAGRPFDFRLSPPARLVLDRTDVDTARAAAPWTLRRLFDRREGVVGLKLDAARFELLYGLTTSLQEIAGLRVAEQDAFVGRVPLSPAVRDRLIDQSSIAERFPRSQRDHAEAFVAWVRGLFARPAQLPVFRDFAARERLSLSDGVTFDLRPSRQTADPFQIDQPHPDQPGSPAGDFDRHPLRGGVDYPFESRNIYAAAIDPKRSKVAKKGEPQGQVDGLVFGALGGSGGQRAGFDEGRTLIITDTTHGRLNALTLVRVGRIARLWNHARHVIVYERATRTAPRYKGEQPAGFEGLAALRKVKEYIEITQPRRGYPDLGVDVGGERPLAGPLTGSFFETTVIPVKSSWGRDIKDGWVMALRGPLTVDEEPFYPSPKIFLELARAAGKGGGAINHLASDPSQLLFFTTTREGLGGDPDAWPAWPDVDFPLTAKPSPPKVPFLPSFSGTGHQPDAAEHDFGLRRFSIDVVPPEEAANLMHGRTGDGLEARVRNVSLRRGQPPANVRSAVDEAVGRTYADAEARLGDGLSELAQHLERLAREGAAQTVAEVAGLREQAKALLDRARDDAETLRSSVAQAASLLDQHAAQGWQDLQNRLQQDAGDEWKKALGIYGTQLGDTLQGIVKDLPGGTIDPELRPDLENRLRGAVEAVCRQAAQRVDGFPFVPQQALERLEAEIGRAGAEAQSTLDGLRAGWLDLLATLRKRFAASDPRVLEQELVDTLFASRDRISAFGASFSRTVKNRLGPLFGDLPGGSGAVNQLDGMIQEIVAAVTDWIDETIENIPPFDLLEPDWDGLRELLDSEILDVDALVKEVRTSLTGELRAKIGEWDKARGDLVASLEAQCLQQAGDLVSLLSQSGQALKDAVNGAVAGWLSHVQDAVSAVQGKAKALFDEARALPVVQEAEKIIKGADLLRDEVVGRIDSLRSQLDDATKTLRDVADQARETLQQAGAGLRRVGEQVEQAVANELRDVVQGAAREAESAGLELVRALAAGPVTDTLRCTREWVGYYYDAAQEALDVTRSGALFNDLGAGALNALSAQVPFDRIRERLLAQLGGFDVNKLFPDFAGLKLENLLGGLQVPEDLNGDYGWIRIRHGFDQERLTAWSEVAIDKQFDGSPELFELPPVTLQVERPRFTAKSRVEASREGLRAQQTEGRLVADWTVTLNGQPVMTITQGGLFFDSSGGFRFDFEAKDLRLAAALQFVTDALRDLLPQEDGLTLTPLFPGGVSVELSLPLPDLGTGAFTLTGVTLYTHFDLLVANGFEIRTGLWLSRPERPFGLAVLFLGGGGWFGVDVRYRPPQEFETRVSVGVSAGAFVALNFGVARGSAGVLLTAGLDFYRNWLQSGTQDLAISIGLLVWGEFSILSIVSAYLRVVLRVEYRNGEMTGYGNVSVSIKICWCFTLRVDAPINLPFKAKGGSASSHASASATATLPPPPRPPVAAAVAAHFANLDL